MNFADDINALLKTYQSMLPMAATNRDRLWKKLRLDWNYNSNRIEGNTLTYGETESLLILGEEPRRIAKDIREMKAHDLAISYVLHLVESDRDISEKDIRDLNQITLKENYFIETETIDGNITRKEVVPGQYKTTPNHVRLRGGGTHRFSEPHEVAARMRKTVESIKVYLESRDKDLPVFLAVLHQDFIQTHPFDDGNGRVVRMLLNYVALKCEWLPVIIKDAKKNDYLAALEQADGGDISGLEQLMRDELSWSLSKGIAAARGEDISDEEDLDKYMDMYLQEVATGYEIKKAALDQKEKTGRRDYFYIIEKMKPIFEKLSKGFEHYKFLPGWSELQGDRIIPANRTSDAQIYSSFNLENWKNFSSKISLRVGFSFDIFDNASDVVCSIEIWRNNSSSSQSLIAHENVNNQEGKFSLVDYKNADEFIRNVKKALYFEIQQFPTNNS